MPEPVAPESNQSQPSPRPAASSYSDRSPSAPPKSPVLSIISMISGIVGLVLAFFGFGILFSIAAVVLGHLGQRKERASKVFWLIGLIAGYLGVLANAAVIIASFILVGAAMEQLPAS